ncbi:ABC transporter ATP-binding protein [Chloroflexota bacterium]
MIEVKDFSIQLGKFSLADINLTIDDKEYFVILGPTGAGKTILLEGMAGLHPIKHGGMWLNQDEVTHLTPEERRIGYVPQDYVLFPFLNVVENIIFGLKRTNHTKVQIKERVTSLSNLLGISHLLDRNTRNLSGGEKQRVALARALAPSPQILLLDEPLSSLDLQTAKYLRLELKRIHHELGLTTIHVTHNQIEAEEIADKIAILNMGRLEQVGSPEVVFFYPGSEMVSDFIGTPNILDCEYCHPLGQGLMEVNSGGLAITLPYNGNVVKRIALFPRDIYVYESEPPGPRINRFKGDIISIRLAGATIKLQVKVKEKVLHVEMPYDIFGDMALQVGQEVFLILKLRRIRVYESKDNSHKKANKSQ